MTLQSMDSKMLSKRHQAQAGDTAAAGKVAGSKPLVTEAFITLISCQEKFSPETEPFSVHALSRAAKHCTWYCQDKPFSLISQ